MPCKYPWYEIQSLARTFPVQSSYPLVYPVLFYLRYLFSFDNLQDNNLIFDTKNEITLPTVLPDPITPPGGNVEAKDFLVQKPLMPTVKKGK
mgnify:CR=1 FL=1